jgi:hypothetical protein
MDQTNFMKDTCQMKVLRTIETPRHHQQKVLTAVERNPERITNLFQRGLLHNCFETSCKSLPSLPKFHPTHFFYQHRNKKGRQKRSGNERNPKKWFGREMMSQIGRTYVMFCCILLKTVVMSLNYDCIFP